MYPTGLSITACKIILNNFVRKYNDCRSFSINYIKKTCNQFKICAPTFSDFEGGYIPHNILPRLAPESPILFSTCDVSVPVMIKCVC